MLTNISLTVGNVASGEENLDLQRDQIDRFLRIVNDFCNKVSPGVDLSRTTPHDICQGHELVLAFGRGNSLVLRRADQDLRQQLTGCFGKSLQRHEVLVLHAWLARATVILMERNGLASSFEAFCRPYLEAAVPLKAKVRCALQLCLSQPTEQEAVVVFETTLRALNVPPLRTIIQFMPGGMAYADAAVLLGGQPEEIELYTRRNRD